MTFGHSYEYGGERGIIPGILPSTLRARFAHANLLQANLSNQRVRTKSSLSSNILINGITPTAVPLKTYNLAFNATITVIQSSSIVDGLEFQKSINVISMKRIEIRKLLVLPAAAGIQRLKSLDPG